MRTLAPWLFALSLGTSALCPMSVLNAETAAATTPAAAALPAKLDVRTAHAKAVAGEIVLVDIRTPEEWRQTGIPASAYAVPLEQQPKTLVAALLKLVDGDRTKPLALICATGGRSSYLAGQLRRVGFAQVIDVSEGVEGSRSGPGWVKSGLPVRPGADAVAPPRLDPAAKGAKP